MSKGARSVLPKHRPKVFKRRGPVSQTEKEFVAQFVQDQPTAITPAQITALSTTMRRSKEQIKTMIEQAKDNFQGAAEYYVDVHKRAVDAALENGDAKSLHVAVQGAQWAMENLSAEGVSILNKKQDSGPGAGKIMIGIQIGGIRQEEVKAGIIEGEKV